MYRIATSLLESNVELKEFLINIKDSQGKPLNAGSRK